MSLYEKPVRQLMHDMVRDLAIARGDIIDREQVIEWFQKNYPRVKRGTVTAHLVLLCTNDPSRTHHNVAPGQTQNDLFFRVAPGRYRLYDPSTDPDPIYCGVQTAAAEKTVDSIAEPVTTSDAADSEFAYEHDLRDFLARNLNLIEPELRLYEDEGVKGVEFPAGGRHIDILAVDAQNALVVIELKVSRGYDRVVGQLLRYIGWIREHQANPGQQVRGIIVAKSISTDLVIACSCLPDVSLYEYDLSVTLRPIRSAKPSGNASA